MDKRRARFRIVYCILILALLSISLMGCNYIRLGRDLIEALDDLSKEYVVVGDFVVRLIEPSYSDDKYYNIYGIADASKEKEELTIPKQIDGIAVTGISSDFGSYFQSPSLKKLFWQGDQQLRHRHIVDACPEFKYVVFTSADPSDYTQFFTENYVYTFWASRLDYPPPVILLDEVKAWVVEHEDIYYVPEYVIDSPSPNVYFNRNYPISFSELSDKFESEWLHSIFSKMNDNEALRDKIIEDLGSDFINEFDNLNSFLNALLSEPCYDELATEFNILNSMSYVWIDYLEEGEQIKTVPSAPIREGYEFMGWYFDELCTQKADFNDFAKGESNLAFYAGWSALSD
ncbi:MAG: InlB B-repeat-containing protein [Bacteroides sp.]|nr:InlB B-repeat-containing protein [Bacillota bacterium]MCM1394129.1 InlB B-repeat-containing protein [[Eubacterium] siraeum]MCM1456051.1 InlB B-repeat-containing protein [Bacteroides sp.]